MEEEGCLSLAPRLQGCLLPRLSAAGGGARPALWARWGRGRRRQLVGNLLALGGVPSRSCPGRGGGGGLEVDGHSRLPAAPSLRTGPSGPKAGPPRRGLGGVSAGRGPGPRGEGAHRPSPARREPAALHWSGRRANPQRPRAEVGAVRAGLQSRPEALRDPVGSSLRGAARAPPPPRGATSERLAPRPLLGARSGEAERSLFPQPSTMTHFNKGPSYGLSAEVKNKVRPGSGGVPGTGRRRGSPAVRRGGVGAAESGRVCASRPGLEAPALGVLLALFPRPGPDGRRAAGSSLPESRRAGPGGAGAGRGCRTRPSGQGALLRGRSLLGGVGPSGRKPREQCGPGLLPTPSPLPPRPPGRTRPRAKRGGVVASLGLPLFPASSRGPSPRPRGHLAVFRVSVPWSELPPLWETETKPEGTPVE